MKKNVTYLLKFFAGIWCVAFVIFILAYLLKTQNIIISFLENYREGFEGLWNAFFSNWFLNLCFGGSFITIFMWALSKSNKDMGWDDLAKKYSFPRDQIKNLNIEFDYGQSYLNDIYYNGIHLSSISRGLILRHPFPFNYLKPALLIPWSEIETIEVKRGLMRDGQNNLFSKLGEKISPWKYANVKLSSFKNISVIIPWKSNVKMNAPEKLITS